MPREFMPESHGSRSKSHASASIPHGSPFRLHRRVSIYLSLFKEKEDEEEGNGDPRIPRAA